MTESLTLASIRGGRGRLRVPAAQVESCVLSLCWATCDSAHILPLSLPPQLTHKPNVPVFSCVIVQPLITMCRTRSTTSPDSIIDPNDIAHASTKSFLGALALNGIILAAEITAFTYMRPYFRLIYEPRSWSFFDEYAFKLLSSSYHGRLILV